MYTGASLTLPSRPAVGSWIRSAIVKSLRLFVGQPLRVALRAASRSCFGVWGVDLEGRVEDVGWRMEGVGCAGWGVGCGVRV